MARSFVWIVCVLWIFIKGKNLRQTFPVSLIFSKRNFQLLSVSAILMMAGLINFVAKISSEAGCVVKEVMSPRQLIHYLQEMCILFFKSISFSAKRTKCDSTPSPHWDQRPTSSAETPVPKPSVSCPRIGWCMRR